MGVLAYIEWRWFFGSSFWPSLRRIFRSRFVVTVIRRHFGSLYWPNFCTGYNTGNRHKRARIRRNHLLLIFQLCVGPNLRNLSFERKFQDDPVCRNQKIRMTSRQLNNNSPIRYHSRLMTGFIFEEKFLLFNYRQKWS